MGVFRKICLPLLTSFGISLLVLESLGHIVRPEVLKDIYSDGPSRLRYNHDENLGWFATPGIRYRFEGSRQIEVSNNAHGFRDDGWDDDGRPRIFVLGDSYVWGYDVEKAERFTEQMQRELPAFRVLNGGVVGYGTDQELLVLRKYYEVAKPSFVILIYTGTNDPFDNAGNFSNGAFKPYFVSRDDRLVLQGVPVPRSLLFQFRQYPSLLHWSYVARGAATIAIGSLQSGKVHAPDLSLPLILSMRDLVKERGAKFLVGYESISTGLLAGLTVAGLAPIDLVTPKRYSRDGTHWTPDGHREVSSKLVSEIIRRTKPEH